MTDQLSDLLHLYFEPDDKMGQVFVREAKALEQRVDRLENGLRELSDPVVYEGIPIFYGTKQPWRIAKEALAEEEA
ncbi:hypothetical protein LCGC14_0693790 [marine sediment metagenome]|uniref:Uncharacterized protein n=1 Tax=marine sediment metagenome TaxID=412755 RepID=A0A0F9TSN9_9ZZZZ